MELELKLPVPYLGLSGMLCEVHVYVQYERGRQGKVRYVDNIRYLL